MTTYIESFDPLCLGRNAPALLHVERNSIDETIQASFHNFTSESTRAELREKNNEYALFLFQYSDSEVSDWWKDSEVIWSTEQDNKIKQRKENWEKLFKILDSEDITSDDISEILTRLYNKHSKMIG